MTSKQRLDKINDILNNDDAFEADCINVGMGNKASSDFEKAICKLLMDIYSVSHPASDCRGCKDKKSV